MSKNTSIFQVNLEGVLRILSESLYSTPNVFIRELLQNSVDAITARKKIHSFEPNINISFYNHGNGASGLVFSDNGIGLNAEEVEQFLSKIGSSSKSVSNVMEDRSSYIGQFGIGMLSCFMVSNEITVKTKRADGLSEGVNWKGNIDGTYQTEISQDQLDYGTSVVLKLREDSELDEDIILDLVEKYATFLKVPVKLYINDQETTFEQKPFSWEKPGDQALFMEQGFDFFGEHFNYGFDIDLPDLKSKGKAYILGRSTHYGENSESRIYIKDMLITDSNHDILPEWAFFVRLVLNSEYLSPTASREEVFENAKKKKVRNALSEVLKEHIVNLSKKHPDTLQKILHYHTVALKSLALEDSDFCKIIFPMFTYETSIGQQTLGQLMKTNSTLLYVTDTDEFNRILPIARANGKLIINAGYIYDASLFDHLSDQSKTHLITRINTSYFGEALKDVDPDTSDEVETALEQLQTYIIDYDCELSIKSFEPATVPGLYHLSDNARKAKDVKIIKEDTDDLWSFVADTMSNNQNQNINATLILNIQNQVVRRLLKQVNAPAARIIIETILFNTMMQSNVPLTGAEQTQMNNNLNYLLENIK